MCEQRIRQAFQRSTPLRTQQLVALFGATILIAGITGACAQIEQRDKRFYYRAPWNFALRENLQALDIEFNGVDFGHSNLYENLLLTGAKDVPAIEEKARKETPALFIRDQCLIPTRKRSRRII